MNEFDYLYIIINIVMVMLFFWVIYISKLVWFLKTTIVTEVFKAEVDPNTLPLLVKGNCWTVFLVDYLILIFVVGLYTYFYFIFSITITHFLLYILTLTISFIIIMILIAYDFFKNFERLKKNKTYNKVEVIKYFKKNILDDNLGANYVSFTLFTKQKISTHNKPFQFAQKRFAKKIAKNSTKPFEKQYLIYLSYLKTCAQFIYRIKTDELIQVVVDDQVYETTILSNLVINNFKALVNQNLVLKS